MGKEFYPDGTLKSEVLANGMTVGYGHGFWVKKFDTPSEPTKPITCAEIALLKKKSESQGHKFVIGRERLKLINGHPHRP